MVGLFICDRVSAVPFLAQGRWVGMRRITNWSWRWNNSSALLNRDMEWIPLVYECMQLLCCCRSICEQSDCATEVPTEEWLILSLPVPASWCAVSTREVTTVLRDDGSANWRAGMTVDADRWDRTLVRESKESGGETIACSRLKCRPKKSRMHEVLGETSSNKVQWQW